VTTTTTATTTKVDMMRNGIIRLARLNATYLPFCTVSNPP